jgi:hypothetical protein
MTAERLLARRAAALANIKAIEAGAPVAPGWISRQQCLNVNRRIVADCDTKLAASDLIDDNFHDETPGEGYRYRDYPGQG